MPENIGNLESYLIIFTAFAAFMSVSTLIIEVEFIRNGGSGAFVSPKFQKKNTSLLGGRN